jgi:hypothetical protein
MHTSLHGKALRMSGLSVERHCPLAISMMAHDYHAFCHCGGPGPLTSLRGSSHMVRSSSTPSLAPTLRAVRGEEAVIVDILLGCGNVGQLVELSAGLRLLCGHAKCEKPPKFFGSSAVGSSKSFAGTESTSCVVVSTQCDIRSAIS